MATFRTVIADAKLSRKVGRKYVPRIFQEYSSVFDLIAPIQFGELDKVIKDFAIVTAKPTIYFGVRGDKVYWYVYYMVYHPWDVSFSAIKFLRKLDSHRHDTEGMLLRIPKEGGGVDLITVNHYRFLCEKNSDRRVVIEKEGHGIRPYSRGGPGGNFIVYKVFDLVDLNRMLKTEWERLRKKLHGVSMPDEQYDTSLSSGPHGRRINKRGDIFLRPSRLIKSMELRGWL